MKKPELKLQGDYRGFSISTSDGFVICTGVNKESLEYQKAINKYTVIAEKWSAYDKSKIDYTINEGLKRYYSSIL